MTRPEKISPENLRRLDSLVPFVYELIPFLPNGISEKLYEELVTRSHEHDLSYMGAQQDRNLEKSGILINLVDICRTQEDAMAYLFPLTTLQMLKINKENPELQKQVWGTLAGNICTPDALVYLDAVFGEMIKGLKQYRGKIFEDIRNKKLPLLDEYHSRTIVYDPQFNNKRILYVTHANIIPPFPPELKHMLINIKPDFLDPNAPEYPVNTERGFLQVIGKFGHPFTRELALYSWHVLHTPKILSPEEQAIEAMREYVETHG